MKLTRLLSIIAGFILIVLAPPKAQALEHWYMPVENQMRTLRAENPSLISQDLWISGPIDSSTEQSEVWYEIPAQSQIEVPLEEFSQFPWIHLKSKDDSPIKLSVRSKNLNLGTLEKGSSNHWTSAKNPTSKVILLNTSAVEQSLNLISNSTTKIIKLAAFEKQKVLVKKGQTLDIQGEQKIVVLFQDLIHFKYLDQSKLSVPLRPVHDSNTAYFLFTDTRKTQSFVVKTNNEALKKQARNQIADPKKYPKKILVGSIGLGHDNTNRDFLHHNNSPWSWHVSNAANFADYASQDCDGSPEFVDEFIKTWMISPGGICFWGYKISEELSEDQIRSGGPLLTPP